MNWTESPLERAVYKLGSIAAVADALELPHPTVRSWRQRGIPEARMPALMGLLGEKHTPAGPVEPVPNGHRVKGVSTLLDPQGNVSAQWVKTVKDEESREEMLVRIFRDLPSQMTYATPSPPLVPGSGRDDLMAVFPIGDPHIGMYAWARETGSDWDLEIAEDLMLGAMRDLVLRGPRTRTALIIPLGDTLHFDNAAHHTTGGDHALDTDGRTMKVVRCAVRVIAAMTEAALEHHEEVILDVQSGNHDRYSSIWLSACLAERYRLEPRVRVVDDASLRHYHRFGRVLIGTVHGDTAKADHLGPIMASERSEDWGATKHRYWYVGHVHHQSVKEYHGCKVETFRTLAGRDAWHAGHGYLSGRDMQRITIHRDFGEIGREVAGLDYLLAKGAA